MRRPFILIPVLTAFMLTTLSTEAAMYIHGFQAMPGDTAQLSLSISGGEEISSFEANLTLPSGLTFIDVSVSQSGKPSDHVVGIRNKASGQQKHIACWSPTNAVLGNRIIVTVAVSKNMPKGTHTVSLTDVLLVTPDGVSLTSNGNKATVEINSNGRSDTFAAFFADAPVSQAWHLRNIDTGFNLQVRRTTGEVTMEKPDNNSDYQRFFIEPAYDLEEGLYYLRSLDGFYVCCTINETTYTLSIADHPSSTSAFVISEIGDRTYSLTIAGSEKRLVPSDTQAGNTVRLSSSSTLRNWQFLLCDASHTTYFERLYLTSAQCMGLTKGKADLDFRCLRHDIRMAVDKGMDDKGVAACIDRLDDAVAAARRAYVEGDSTIVEELWGDAEDLVSVERVITTTTADGYLRFLTLKDGQLCLIDQFSTFVQDASNPILQDAFYNPYSDSYAVRLSGEEHDRSGRYLAYDALSDSVVDTTVTSLSESLSVWSVLSLPQAIQRYLVLTGKSGVNVDWNFDLTTGTLTFDGMLRTNAYAKLEQRPWHTYRHLVSHVVFVGKISMLGANLLNGCSNVESMTFISASKPAAANGAFDGLPAGIDIYAPNPDDYEGYLPDCKTHFLAHLQDTYVYDGTNQTPVVDGPYDAAVTDGILEKDAGTYTSTFTITINIDGKTYNHVGPFTYTIQPAPLAVTVREYSRNYGAKNPTFRAAVSGYQGGDTEKSVFVTKPVATCEANETSPVGMYPILISGGTLSSDNYVLNYQYGTLTVRQKPLAIIADNVTRYVGEPNPLFTYSCAGFVNGDDESVLTEEPVLTCVADSTSAPGKYPITVSGGAALNYSMSYASGLLTILEGTGLHPLKGDGDSSEEVVYDLLGRRVHTIAQAGKNLAPGIYIINGKKTIIK